MELHRGPSIFLPTESMGHLSVFDPGRPTLDEDLAKIVAA